MTTEDELSSKVSVRLSVKEACTNSGWRTQAQVADSLRNQGVIHNFVNCYLASPPQ
jgi:hypothetical protein